MQKRWLWVVIVSVLIIVAVTPKLVVVPMLSEQLRGVFQEEFQTEQVQVQIQAPLGWELVFGKLPKLAVTMERAVVDGFNLATVQITGSNLRFAPQKLVTNWETAYQGADELSGVVTIIEADLNSLLWAELDSDFNFAISPEGLALNGWIPFFYQEIPFTLYGVLEPVTGAHVRFIPRDFEVQATRIPQLVLEVLNEGYDFVLDFSIFPYPVQIEQILLEDKQLKISFGVIL